MIMASLMNQESVSSCNFAPNPIQQVVKKKRNQPGNPDPEAEVIALSPKTLLATNRFVCEICNKGFQRDQNLQLHRRGHNLPWKLKQRTSKEIRKKVYVCPEKTCVHHEPSRALGDLTGIKKHFSRKHGEKKWKCVKCSKCYAVQSDWKAHSKTCGTKEYRCDCGTLFSRRDSFITHRAFCDALAEESARAITTGNNPIIPSQTGSSMTSQLFSGYSHEPPATTFSLKKEQQSGFNLRPEIPPWLLVPPPIFLTQLNPNPSSHSGATMTKGTTPHISATALLQKAAEMGATVSNNVSSVSAGPGSSPGPNMLMRAHHQTDGFFSTGFEGSNYEDMTKDFLGLRSLSGHDIFNFAGLVNTASSEHQNHGFEPWKQS